MGPIARWRVHDRKTWCLTKSSNFAFNTASAASEEPRSYLKWQKTMVRRSMSEEKETESTYLAWSLMDL